MTQILTGKVICPAKDECGNSYCIHAELHEHSEFCTIVCNSADGKKRKASTLCVQLEKDWDS